MIFRIASTSIASGAFTRLDRSGPEVKVDGEHERNSFYLCLICTVRLMAVAAWVTMFTKYSYSLGRFHMVIC
jgi:hypothetical protein